MLLLALLLPRLGHAQALENGLPYSDSISVANPQDTWTLTAAVGDTLILRVGTDTFNPRIDLLAPGTSVPKSSFNAGANGRDTELTYVVTNAGTHTVTISSYYANGAGNYTLSLARGGAFQVAPGDQGGPMTNGFQHTGTIGVGDLDLWSFSANAGDNLVVRMGTVGFNPYLRLLGPTGLIVANELSTATGGRDVELTFRATNSGSYTLVAASTYLSVSGSYTLTLAKAPGAFQVAPGDQGGPMTNGLQHTGSIDVGDLDLWSFSANAGDSLVVRMGTVGFNPYIRLFGPTGLAVANGQSTATGGRDVELTFRATNSGSYTLVAASSYLSVSGSYTLTLAKAPGAITVSPGDEGGPMTNGMSHTGTLDIGDLDVWEFSANAGDNLFLRMGTVGFNPYIRLFSPLGVPVASGINTATGGRDVDISFRATNSGTYTLVAAGTYANSTGTYTLNLVKAPGSITVVPGDDGGPMINGAQHAGVIDVGDLDAWQIQANAGDYLLVRIGTTGFNPYIRLISPLGLAVGNSMSTATGGRDAEIAFRATNSGTFTLVVAGTYFNNTGPYTVTLAQSPGPITVSPGDTGGPMTNGVQHTGTIDIGELDMWSFTANANDNLVVRIGTTGFNPSLRLFSPLGILVADESSTATLGRDIELTFKATNSGSYTIVAASTYDNGTGPYTINLGRFPAVSIVSSGDEGGPMSSGYKHTGQFDVGDLDVWTFSAGVGDNIVVRMGTTTANPQMRIYGPTGVLIFTGASVSTGVRDLEAAVTATNAGVYSVLVNSYYLNGTGDYIITLADLPGPVSVAVGDQGGPMTNAVTYAGTIDIGDLDLWTFQACRGTPLSIQANRVEGTTALVPRLRLYGLRGALLASAQGTTLADLSYVTTNSGSFILVLSSANLNNSGDYQLTALGITENELQLCAPAVVGTNLFLGGFGGAPGTQFIIYSATNVTLPGSQWLPWATNQFDATGLFELKRNFDRREFQRYFRLQLP